MDIRLPDVGEGLEEGEIVAWRVAPGDVVARDQPLVEVQTDKATVELPSPAPGRVVRLAAAAGDIVKVGDLLLVLEDGTSPAEPASPERPQAGRPKAAPTVRKLALERGVDLAEVTGTGPGGRILAGDVEAHAGGDGPQSRTPPATKPSPAGRQPLRGIRRVTAETMARSWSEIPHITVMDELDATRLLEARRRLEQAAGAEVTLAALFVAAVARALRRHPLMNASLDLEAGEIVVHDERHVGLAVATDAGLVVPVVRHADHRPLRDLAAEVRRLTTAARAGEAALADLQGGTFTVNNYGSLGGRFATPLIRPPEVGIMGFGAVRPRPFVVEGAVVARPTLPYCCSADHRLVDGDLLTAFSQDVATLLADPVGLLAELLLGD